MISEYEVPLIPLISIKYVIEVIAIPPKIDETIFEFLLKSKLNINLDTHCTIAPIVNAIKTEDVELASKLLKGFKKNVTTASDRIVNHIISGELNFNTGSESAATVLYARYLKRIGSHLKNITTTVINPIDSIGYLSLIHI